MITCVFGGSPQQAIRALNERLQRNVVYEYVDLGKLESDAGGLRLEAGGKVMYPPFQVSAPTVIPNGVCVTLSKN